MHLRQTEGERRAGLRHAPAWGADDRLHRLKLTLALALLGGFALSPRLWLSSARFYPLAPVSELLPDARFPLDYVWLAALGGLLGAAILSATKSRQSLAAFVVLAALLALWDQMRWQPWFYQYLCMLAALALYAWPEETGETEERREERRAAALNTCRLIVAAVYFWSGMQKLSLEFAAGLMPNLLKPFLAYLPEALRFPFGAIGWVAPFVEIFLGVGLLTRRWRNVAVRFAVGTHLLILALFIPLWRNSVVWPWNVAMIAFVLLLFRCDRSFALRDVLLNGWRRAHAVVLLLFGLLPGLGFFGLWDAYPSFSLYSGQTSVALLRFDEGVRARLPPAVGALAQEDPAGGFVLPLDRWSYAELNVPAYPERRVYRRLARRLCAGLGDPAELTLDVRGPPGAFSRERPASLTNCEQLQAARR